MLESNHFLSGLFSVLKVFMNPSLLPYNEIERSLGSVVFIGLLILFIGLCIATLRPLIGKAAAIAFGVVMAFSLAAMRGGIEFVVIIMGMTGAFMKLVGGIALALYCIFVPVAGLVMVLLTALCWYFLMSFNLEILPIFKVAMLVFSGIQAGPWFGKISLRHSSGVFGHGAPYHYFRTGRLREISDLFPADWACLYHFRPFPCVQLLAGTGHWCSMGNR
jgi:hypothetical protein